MLVTDLIEKYLHLLASVSSRACTCCGTKLRNWYWPQSLNHPNLFVTGHQTITIQHKKQA